MKEKSVRKSPSGIIYRATPHLSQAARADSCPKREAGSIRTVARANNSTCSHVLLGTGAEWPGILYCSETSEHSFLLSSFIPSLRLLRHLNLDI